MFLQKEMKCFHCRHVDLKTYFKVSTNLVYRFLDRIGINMGGWIIAEVAKCFSMCLLSLLASLLCHMYQMCLTMHEMLVFPFATNVNNLEYIHKIIKSFMKLQFFLTHFRDH